MNNETKIKESKMELKEFVKKLLTATLFLCKIYANYEMIIYKIYSQLSIGGLINIPTADNTCRRFYFKIWRGIELGFDLFEETA